MQKLSKKSMDFCQSTLLLISRGMERCGIFFPLKFHFYNYSRLCYIYKHAVDMAKGKVLDVLCSATYLHKECILYIIVLHVFIRIVTYIRDINNIVIYVSDVQ